MSRMQQVIEALEAERDDLKERVSWIEDQITAFRERDASAPAASSTSSRSRRRSSSSRRSRGRAGSSRSGRPSAADSIVEYLSKHPNSTAGDLADALGLKRNSLSTKLTQMAREGKIAKADRGYALK